MSETKLRDNISRLGRSLFERGLTPGSSGNISVKLDDGGWLVTPTNASLGFLDPVRLSLLSADGRLLSSGDRAALEELLPRLVHVALPHRVEGVYDVTPDHQAILGRVRDRVWVAAGFSGHGFMQAPAVGRILAEAILDGREDEALRVLDAGRFAEGRLVHEPQVV